MVRSDAVATGEPSASVLAVPAVPTLQDLDDGGATAVGDRFPLRVVAQPVAGASTGLTAHRIVFPVNGYHPQK